MKNCVVICVICSLLCHCTSLSASLSITAQIRVEKPKTSWFDHQVTDMNGNKRRLTTDTLVIATGDRSQYLGIPGDTVCLCVGQVEQTNNFTLGLATKVSALQRFMSFYIKCYQIHLKLWPKKDPNVTSIHYCMQFRENKYSK